MKFLRTLIVSVAALVSTVAVHAEAPRYTYVDLGPLPFVTSAQCQNTCLNSKGWVAGTFLAAGSPHPHSFLYDGTFNDLGTLWNVENPTELQLPDFSWTFGLNDNGDVVGQSNVTISPRPQSYIPQDVGFVYLYMEKKMFDLNSLVDGLLDEVVINAAFSINNKGDILATAVSQTWFSSGKHTLLLSPVITPIPEPNVSALFFAGLVGLLFARKRYVKVT